MTMGQLLQFYMPLAGLIALAFWSGVLTQRVRGLEADVKDARIEIEKSGGSSERIVRLETKMDSVSEQLTSINRNLSGVQRQLANISSKSLHGLSSAS